MAKKTKEEKLADLMEECLNDHFFNTSLFANIMTTDYPLYTQERLMKLIANLINYSQRRFEYEWEAGETTEGLLLADALNDTLKQLGKNTI